MSQMLINEILELRDDVSEFKSLLEAISNEVDHPLVVFNENVKGLDFKKLNESLENIEAFNENVKGLNEKLVEYNQQIEKSFTQHQNNEMKAAIGNIGKQQTEQVQQAKTSSVMPMLIGAVIGAVIVSGLVFEFNR